ncbi:hypothetical protein ACFO25_01755 [Paenactinomyces guangxiensis]|uniref:Uncharacterized protein n=1 Tax=Paenactinomyces guangxiensis TaxID=1490290 RepID=A0A7W1WS49_9BACL|nr:hypothetical protein [Paenactinomyces guangxiensis]MBA4494953.1 hypothetical protein [Paenactinomyces guangxiensis]MBH8592036.1 hypothetical protein [Paenactinomyces guangxiensis]
MPCSNRNLLVNGGFSRGLVPWTGSNINRLPNPVYGNDFAVLMGKAGTNERSVLKQTVPGPFEQECSYYLYFRVLNVTPQGSQARLFAAVAYLDRNQEIIRSTPLLILPPQARELKWFPYFTIVPPPPANARNASVIFLLQAGVLFVDYIRLASHSN